MSRIRDLFTGSVKKRTHDQQLIRIIRQAINLYAQSETPDERQDALFFASALASASQIQDLAVRDSFMKYIQSRMFI